MPSSFISIDNDCGFWVRDTLFEITCAYLVKTIDNFNKGYPEWLKQMRELIKENSLGYYASYMHLHLPEYLTTDDRKSIFLEILERTLQYLETKGELIEAEEMNNLINGHIQKGYWSTPLRTELVLKSVDFLKLLVSGELKIMVSDPVNYW